MPVGSGGVISEGLLLGQPPTLIVEQAGEYMDAMVNKTQVLSLPSARDYYSLSLEMSRPTSDLAMPKISQVQARAGY